ncbi:MAG TPA: hypothetical protein VKP03_00320 [Patescibacteria group bacterium]|nr:hypothetical protein [Patescibacteria group bacterium]
MIIVGDYQIKSEPLIDLTQKNQRLESIINAVEEYVMENRQKAIIKGKPLEVFHVSGLASQHAPRLTHYLNHKILKNYSDQAQVEQGSFANYPGRHYWIEINDLIIDLGFKQFADKRINVLNSLRPFLQYYCFISNNSQNPFYRMYRKD